MAELERWHFATRLSDFDAAALIVGMEPDEVHGHVRSGDFKDMLWWDAVDCWLQEMSHALEFGELIGGTDTSDDEALGHFVSFMVDQVELVNWLERRGDRSPFFFPNGERYRAALPAYLDVTHVCYSPKLAAAVRAWEGIVADLDAGRSLKKNAKQTLKRWLDAHRTEFKYQAGKKQGQPLEPSTLTRIAQVANWDPYGGVPPSSPKKPAKRRSRR